MNNVAHLRSILKEFGKNHKVDISEAEEFLDSIDEELSDSEDKIIDLEDEKKGLEDRLDEFEGYDYEQHYNLGLDCIYVRFEKGNINIRQKFEAAMSLIAP